MTGPSKTVTSVRDVTRESPTMLFRLRRSRIWCGHFNKRRSYWRTIAA